MATASAPWAFIHFVCEGTRVSWHYARPTAETIGLPLPPVAATPLWLQPRIAFIALELPDGSRYGGSLESKNLAGTALNTMMTSPRPRVSRNRWTDRPPENVTEGELLSSESLPIIRLLDIDGRPVKGARALAVVAGNGPGRPFPLRHEPPTAGLNLASVPEEGIGAKPLHGAVSTASDEHGVVAFPQLRFGTAGPSYRLLQSLSICSEGMCTDGSSEDAPTFQVQQALRCSCWAAAGPKAFAVMAGVAALDARCSPSRCFRASLV